MAEAREAVQNARLQAEQHVTAVLRGTEQRLGAVQEASAKQLTANARRRALADHLLRWHGLLGHGARTAAVRRRA